MAKIQLPEILVKVTKLPTKTFYIEAGTVTEAVNQLCMEHDVLKEHLFHGNGQFKDHFLLTVDGELVDANNPLGPESSLDIILV